MTNENIAGAESRDYTTQMDAARRGIVTPEIQLVAEKEKMDVDKLMKLVAEGKVAIPANKNHKSLNAEGIGSMLRTKINVNLGVSRDCKDYDIEMEKVMSAVNMGAEAIMDLPISTRIILKPRSGATGALIDQFFPKKAQYYLTTKQNTILRATPALSAM